MNNFIILAHFNYNFNSYINDSELADKMVVVAISNQKITSAKLNSYVVYLSAVNKFKEQLDELASDNEFIYIDSTHENIINKDLDKFLNSH